MKPCLNLATVLRADLEEGIRCAAEAGFEAVELWVDSLERYLDQHTVEDLRILLDKHHVSVFGIGDIESITFCTGEQFGELQQRCDRLASAAGEIGCPTLVASASVRPRNADARQIAEETASVLGKILDIVEPHGVELALAFRGFMWCAVNTLEQVQEAIEHHAHRRIGMALDTFDLHNAGIDPQRLGTLDHSRVSVMRLSDSDDVPQAVLSETARTLPGEGVASLDEMLKAMKEAGFAGPVSIKILNPKLWGLGSSEIADIAMKVAEQYVPKLNVKEDE